MMKPLFLSCLLLFSGALWAQPERPWLLAQADAGDRWERRAGDFPRQAREERLERREARRQWLDSRQAERSGAPAEGFSAPGFDDRHRLSPEERQRLRRDVHDAGREFYPRGNEGPGARQFNGDLPGGGRPPRRP